MMGTNPFFLIGLSVLAILSHFGQTVPIEFGATDFDYLLFDQQWAITECLHWKRMNNTNTCSLPQNLKAFTVHGLWPTKIGTSGPNSCSSQPKFDRKALDPILPRMKQRWFNVHGGTDDYGFWAHEWQKHGTCARVLEPFNSILKYFNRTLDLNSSYDIYGALAEYGIVPDDRNYAVDDILTGIIKKFGKNPQIYCIVSGGEALLQSIKLCFDKTVKLIDCSSVGVGPKNCRGQKSVKYLKKLPAK